MTTTQTSKYAGHTPGPWTAEITDRVRWNKVGYITSEKHEKCIAFAYQDKAKMLVGEAAANARLIAAAPDLLAACKIALRMMQKYGHTHDNQIQEPTYEYLDMKDTGESAPLSDVLAAAIQKAEGK